MSDVKDLSIVVDTTKMTFGDLRFVLRLSTYGKDNIPPEELPKMLDLLDNVVVGGIDHLPLPALPQIIEALSAAMAEDAARKN